MPTDLRRVVTAQENRVRVEFELQRNPLTSGELTWVKVRVTNVGRTDLTWFHDGCSSVGGVEGESRVAWAMGIEQPGGLGLYKTYALGGHIAEKPSPFARVRFVPKDLLGQEYGCADIGISETIKPGESRRQTRWWSGFSERNRALLPTGPATLTAWSGSFWRGTEPERISDSTSFSIEFDGWVHSAAPNPGSRRQRSLMLR